MIEDVVDDYASYFKLDLGSNFQTIQDVIDNMITRLEELTSVLQMIKMKNNDCMMLINDLSKHKSEITILTKKIITISEVISKLQNNVEILERKVEKAENDFGISYDNKIKSFLRPFLKRKDTSVNEAQSVDADNLQICSVTEYFECNNR